jgi:hypothetical protein
MEKMVEVPSRWHYAIGVAVLIVGFVIFTVLLLTQLTGSTPQIQVVVPGVHEIYLAESGKYTVFYEYQSVIDGRIYLTGESLPPILCTLKSKEDSREVVLSRPSGSGTYEIGGRAGVSMLEFEIEEPGTYIFTANYSDDVSEPEVVFAIGQFKLLSTILISLGILFGTLIVGGFIIVRTFLKRQKEGK